LNLSTWEFDANFDAARRARLEQTSNYEDVIERIAADMTAVRWCITLGTAAGLEDCRRAEFTFDVCPETYDDFFNGPGGYRAQYLRDAEMGDAANRRLLSRVRERLLSLAGHDHGPHEMYEGDLWQSLEGISAKVWIDENRFPFENPPRDLAVGLWLASARLNIREARWGLHAPRGKTLQIKGAFLDTWGNEVVPRTKIGRRYQIQALGFA